VAFDRMSCHGVGGYRIDTARRKNSLQQQQQQQQKTIRFFIQTTGIGGCDDGSNDTAAYGDVNIPAGCLYFFINQCLWIVLTQLSKKKMVLL
jgi:hypothetical protein